MQNLPETARNVDRVLLAAPRGFCAGVEMAIKALAWMVRTFPAPVYCYHEIVHNRAVVDRFLKLGVIFVDDISEVPMGMPIMLSAHGSAPQVVEMARQRGNYVVDSVCPLVTKVHHEVRVRAGKGFRIVYVGHEGHEEAVGTMAVAPDSISRVESMKYPSVWSPGKSDLCFATTNRQSALLQIAAQCDSVIVIGSANSSNTRALEKLAHDEGCEHVYRINSVDELPRTLHGVVGVTAGASAPEDLVNEVLAFLNPVNGVEEVRITREEEYFPPPRNIRQLQSGIENAALTMIGASISSATSVDDRLVSASDVLSSLD